MKISLTIAQGTNLLRFVRDAKWPEAIGESKFNYQTRATFAEEIRQLYKALKRVSPIMESEKVPCFGPRDAWNVKQATQAEIEAGADPESYSPKDEAPDVEVELTGKAKSGLYRILLLWLHPLSKSYLPIGRQDDAAWPFAEKIGAVQALTKAIGLDENQTVEIPWDKDPASTAEPKPIDKASSE